MKICFLADINSTHTQKWLDYFLNEGHEIYVITLTEGSFKDVKVFNLGINKNVAIRKSSLSKVQYLTIIKRVKKILNIIKPDIFNAHYASSYGLIGAMCNYHPYVLSFWGSDVYDFPRRSKLHSKIIEYNIKQSDVIFSTGKTMRDEIQKYNKINKDIYITPFGVDVDFFDGTKKKHEDINIGITKSLESIYGIDILVKVFYKLCQKYDNIYLKVAGKGSKISELNQLCVDYGISKRVEFKGFLGLDKLKEFYKLIDIAVFPSRAESFGVAAVEAQANKIPVVTSNAPGFNDTVIDGKTGFVAEIDNVEDFIKKVDILLKNEIMRKQFGENGRKFVCENFKLKDNFKNVENIFNKLINKKIYKRRN